MTATLPTCESAVPETTVIAPILSVENATIAKSTTGLDVPIVPEQPCWTGNQVFWSTFVTIFLAELGDKTQITTLLMTAESHSPWIVFLGAAVALVTTSLLGVLLGQWLAQKLSPKVLNTVAGVMLLLVATLLVIDLLQ